MDYCDKKIVTLLLVSFIFSFGQKNDLKEILFVCTHGTARSLIATDYFNKMAKEKDLNFRAIFRGTEPDSVLTGGNAKGLTKDDFDIALQKSEIVSENDIDNAYGIITFDCQLSSSINPEKTEQWNGTPPISKNYDQTRDVIKEKVNRLVETLAKNNN